MEVSKTSLSGVPVLRVTGDVDHATAPDFERAIGEALSLDGGRLLLDLTDCRYLDSAGLAVLISSLRQVRGGGWLGVVGSNANVLRLFDVIGLGSIPAFRVFDSPEQVSRVVAGEVA